MAIRNRIIENFDAVMPHLPLCNDCVNRIGGAVCAAYPNGIPKEILTGEHDHRKPYSGDNGIRFEPIKEEPKK